MKKFLLLLVLIVGALPAESQDVTRSIFAARQAGYYRIAPSAAYNPDTKQTLVVWERHPATHQGHSIWGRFLNPLGKPTGPIFQVVGGPNPYYPSVIYDPFKKGFLLIYSNEITGILQFEIFVQRLGSNGHPTGPAVRISLASDVGQQIMNDRPIAALNPVDGSYGIFWIRDSLTDSPSFMEGFYGAVIDQNLMVTVPATFLQPQVVENNIHLGPYGLDAEYHSASNRFIVAVYNSSADSGAGALKISYGALTLESRLQNAPPARQVVNNTPANPASPSVEIVTLPNNTSFLMFADTNGTKRRNLSPQGTLSGSNVFLLQGTLRTKKLAFPSIATANNKTFLVFVGVEDFPNATGNGTIWAQKLDATGKTSGKPLSVDAGFDAAMGLLLTTLPPTTTIQPFASIYRDGEIFTDPAAGLILLNIKYPLL